LSSFYRSEVTKKLVATGLNHRPHVATPEDSAPSPTLARASAEGQNGPFSLEIRTKNQTFLENLESAVSFRLVDFRLVDSVNSWNGSLFAVMTLALHMSQIHSSGVVHVVMSLQFTFTPVCLFACRGKYRVPTDVDYKLPKSDFNIPKISQEFPRFCTKHYIALISFQ